jgi:hypothetical protein
LSEGEGIVGGFLRLVPADTARGPSDGMVLAVIVGIATSALVSVLLTPKPPSIVNPTGAIWSGFIIGLFACTLLLGLLLSLVHKQDEVGMSSDWNIPVSKITIAKWLTATGWLAGAINCYLISYDLARNFG